MKKLLPLFCLLLMGCPPAPIDPATLPDLSRPAPPVAAPAPVVQGVEPIANTSFTSSHSVAVVLVIDTSGSMSGDKLDTVKRITTGQIADRLVFFSLTNRLDVSVITCGGSAQVRLPLSKFDPNKFKSTIQGLSSDGGTPLTESLIAAFEELSHSKRAERHLFVLSDGRGNSSVGPTLTVMNQKGLDTIIIHVIGFKTDRDNYKPFEEVGAQVLMAADNQALEDSMAFTFHNILKLEADDE